MDQKEPPRSETGAGAQPGAQGFDFEKIKARLSALRARHPALDRAVKAVLSIRWQELLSTLRNRLIAGVLIAIPIIVTVWVLQIAFNFISTISLPWLTAVGIQAPREVAFFVTLLALLGLGFMATNVIGARIIAGIERLMLRIPGVAPVFSATKQIIEAFKGMSGPTSFQRVVYVEYPSPGCRLIGFVTGQYYDPVAGKELTAVFLPTCPNPITGFVLAIDSENVVDAPFGLDEATKMLVSVGLVTPKGSASQNAAAAGQIEALARLGGKPVSSVGVSTIEIVKGQPPRLEARGGPEPAPPGGS